MVRTKQSQAARDYHRPLLLATKLSAASAYKGVSLTVRHALANLTVESAEESHLQFLLNSHAPRSSTQSYLNLSEDET
jgi:hypothetical protein